jgi:hypothetical protein
MVVKKFLRDSPYMKNFSDQYKIFQSSAVAKYIKEAILK